MIKRWPSPSKLNLFLYIIGRFVNGYHYLQTLFQLIDYGDSIEFIITNDGKIRLFNATDNTIIQKDNLIVQAAMLLRNYCGSQKKKLGADIILHKVIPIGSGLGGGSSNAATTLIVLNKQWKCYFKKSILMNLGSMLGSDVPIFVHGYSSFGEGVGNKLTPIVMPQLWYLIVIPPISISTTQVFHAYKLYNRNYSPCRSVKELLQSSFFNDLEPIAKKIFPEIEIYFQYLLQYTSARLTGTGSCIFSEFRNARSAYQIQGYLPSWIKSIVVQGMQISPLNRIL